MDWHSLKADFAKKALYDIIKNSLLVVIAFCVATLSTKISSNFMSNLGQYKWELIITLASILAFIFLITSRRFDKYRPNYPKLDFDYELAEKEITYEYRDKTHMLYKKRLVVKALKKGLNVYKDKYQWTGKGKINIKSTIQEQQVFETERKNVWQLYEIRLPKNLNINETMPTEVVWELEDQEEKAVPFFSATIEEPTEKLRFNLCLPNHFNVKEVICETSSSIGSQKPLESITKPLVVYDGKSCVTWEITCPKLLYHYEVKWNINK